MRQEQTFEDVAVEADGIVLLGMLARPDDAKGIVIFAHGSGSSRHSTRNQAVAQWLVEKNCATLLFDLLSVAEANDRRNVFDIPLLSQRVVAATRWWKASSNGVSLPIGYFGASTGAGAALMAASEMGDEIAAVVSRGGRPDLAIPLLSKVVSPTMLIVGSRDETVLDLNRKAQHQLRCENELVVIDGATHLFEEPGTLEQAAAAAADWFVNHFAAA